MITVTRLNGKELAVNAELIKCIEETPDTVITMTGGDLIVVREPLREVIGRVLSYRRSLLEQPAGIQHLP